MKTSSRERVQVRQEDCGFWPELAGAIWYFPLANKAPSEKSPERSGISDVPGYGAEVQAELKT